MTEKKNWSIIQFGDPIKGANAGIDKAINETLAAITTEVKEISPTNKKKDGGRLRNSWMYRGPGKDGGFNDSPGIKARGGDKLRSIATNGVGYVGSNLDYATYQEFGTKNMKPQPSLRPAVASVNGEGLKSIAKTINEEVKKWTEQSAKRKKK